MTEPLPSAVAAAGSTTGDLHDVVVHLVLQLAVILIASQIAGQVFRRAFKLPGVLGELIVGMLIGPYALGGVALPGIGPLFPVVDELVPVPAPLYGIASVASILLLFMAGLETDLGLFLRYSAVGTAVGIGGVVFSFGLGAMCAVWFGIASSFMDPVALFLGAISTATSVGITARILSERRKTDSPEGVTILAAAVFDDVLGVIALAIVVGLSKRASSSAATPWADIGRIAAKAIGYWLGFTALGLISARPISRSFKVLRTMSSIVSVAFGLALFFAGLLEMVGLAMIIGAFVTGLSLSRTDLAHGIQEHLRGTRDMLVPVFFCVMGMLVDWSKLGGVLVFGLIYSATALLSKLLGCGLPALLSSFNVRGAFRIGLGMAPRGEVALVIAGLGLSSGVISKDVFGAAILMTMLTTLLVPPVLNRSFAGGSGLKATAQVAAEDIRTIPMDFPSPELAEFVLMHMLRDFRAEEFFVYRLGDTPAWQIRKDDMSFTLSLEGARIILTTVARHEHVARFIVLEALVELQDMAQSFHKLQDLDTMRVSLVEGLFDRNSS